MFTISRWAAVPSWGLDHAKQAARRFALRRDGVLRVDAFGRGVVLRCEAGTVLVTRLGDLEDHVLEPGQQLRLQRRDAGVAWALTDASVSLEGAEETRRGAATWLRALRRAVAGPALLAASVGLTAAFVLSVG